MGRNHTYTFQSIKAQGYFKVWRPLEQTGVVSALLPYKSTAWSPDPGAFLKAIIRVSHSKAAWGLSSVGRLNCYGVSDLHHLSCILVPKTSARLMLAPYPFI